ncbi:hypothetical protein ALP96_200108 [Pseudomonas savastanoi pv. glycinea]|uniref:Uncharacterized protein n=1 Tax=Pseudomonas syringae pv. spinaceae TaxID=264459 RepID=A0A0P9ZC42_PSESX|nr:hypothetical protein ALO94_201188 [Pseudomonas syringae pv. spinaceae]RMQ87384.1 hypothetical protein ALP96_200108 [Pseudomonas savastanoi pv. glycinea]
MRIDHRFNRFKRALSSIRGNWGLITLAERSPSLDRVHTLAIAERLRIDVGRCLCGDVLLCATLLPPFGKQRCNRWASIRPRSLGRFRRLRAGRHWSGLGSYGRPWIPMGSHRVSCIHFWLSRGDRCRTWCTSSIPGGLHLGSQQIGTTFVSLVFFSSSFQRAKQPRSTHRNIAQSRHFPGVSCVNRQWIIRQTHRLRARFMRRCHRRGLPGSAERCQVENLRRYLLTQRVVRSHLPVAIASIRCLVSALHVAGNRPQMRGGLAVKALRLETA